MSLWANSTSSNSSCEPFRDNPHRCTVILNIRHTMASISIISCVFCLFIIWAFRKYENFSQRLVTWLTVAALFDSCAYVMGDLQANVTPYCTAQGFLLQYFDWSSLMWVCCISFNLFWNVIRSRPTQKFEVFYHLISWLIPLLFACIPLSQNDGYAPAGLWCWINMDYIYMRFFLWYIPVWIAAVSLVVVYIYIIRSLKRQADSWEGTYNPDTQRIKDNIKEDITGLKYYPLVYIVISIFPTVNRIQNAASHGTSNVYALLVLHTLTSPLQGFLNALVFTFDRDTRSRLTFHQLWAAVRSRLSRSHIIKPYNQASPRSSSSETTSLTESLVNSGAASVE